jgi:hypothetical protein
MHNGAQNSQGRVCWAQSSSRPKTDSERWNRPSLQNGSHTFWQEIQARRAPRSELEWEHTARQSSDILNTVT